MFWGCANVLCNPKNNFFALLKILMLPCFATLRRGGDLPLPFGVGWIFKAFGLVPASLGFLGGMGSGPPMSSHPSSFGARFPFPNAKPFLPKSPFSSPLALAPAPHFGKNFRGRIEKKRAKIKGKRRENTDICTGSKGKGKEEEIEGRKECINYTH